MCMSPVCSWVLAPALPSAWSLLSSCSPSSPEPPALLQTPLVTTTRCLAQAQQAPCGCLHPLGGSMAAGSLEQALGMPLLRLLCSHLRAVGWAGGAGCCPLLCASSNTCTGISKQTQQIQGPEGVPGMLTNHHCGPNGSHKAEGVTGTSPVPSPQ